MSSVLPFWDGFTSSITLLPGGLSKEVGAPCLRLRPRGFAVSKREIIPGACDAQPPWIQGAGELASSRVETASSDEILS